MIPARALACLAIILAASPRSAGPGGMPAAEAYVWQRVWTPELVAALQANADVVTRWHVLIAQGGAHGPFARFAPDWGAIARAGRPAIPVIRIDGQIDPLAVARLAQTAAALIATVPAAARARIEIDHDCATARLASYAEFLATVRGLLPPGTRIDITALPTWLHAPDLGKLIAAADRLILQVHGIDDPRTALFDPARASAWVGALSRRTTRPFVVAVPAYGARIVRDANGGLQAASAERVQADPRPGSELIVAPADVAAFLQRLRLENADQVAGIVWFRLPLPGDLRAWSATTLRHVSQGRKLSPHVRVSLQPALADAAQQIALVNDGDDTDLPARLTLSPGCAGDAIGAYISNGRNFMRIRNDLLRSGAHMVVGWQLCPHLISALPEVSMQ